MNARGSNSRPSVVGYWISAPHRSIAAGSAASSGPTCSVSPIDSARVRTTPIVCGWQSCATKNPRFWPRATPVQSAIASAAAVASSSSEAFASGSAVRSATIVWKFSSASSRPCEISA
jgi:hypothetical protein